MDRFRNQRLIIDDSKLGRTRFVVVGAGAIGSAFVVGLSKMGARDITVYDFDNLEDHNFANQFYPVSQLGRPKVEALKTIAKDYGDCSIRAINDPWTPDNAIDADVVVAAVDNMAVRAAIFHYYTNRRVGLNDNGLGGVIDLRPSLFLDGRMGALVYRCFHVLPTNDKQVEHYRASLHTQAEGSQERCGEKSIIFTVQGVASCMLDMVKGHLMGEDYIPTEVVYDFYNYQIHPTYHVERKLEVFTENENGN